MGLRERKKAKTRAAIQQHALRLFRQQGYAETTVEQIAEAAEVSTSTFFRYFPNKEDVVLNDEYDPQIIAAFHAQPLEFGVVKALRNAIVETLKTMSEEEIEVQHERGKLIMAVPEVRSAFFNSLAQSVQMITQAVAERVHRDPADFEIYAMGGAFLGIGLAVSFLWLENENTDPATSLDEALSLLESGFHL